jgi:hypothetical protein
MSDTVRVQFSASIGALIKGVDDAKKAIESVKESTDKVTAGAKSLLEAFGIAFSTDKLVEMIGQMAELGEQVERSKAILGTSTKSVQELGFIAKMTGGDAEGLSLAMERLQVNLQKAQSGAGPAYQALQALGLSAKQLSSVTLDQQLNKIANAFAKFGDGPNKTAIAIELLGRAGAQMIPVLDQGSEGLEKLRASADNSGAVLSRTAVDSLSALERSLVGLKAAVTGVAGALTAELAPALTRVITGTTELIGGVNVAIQTHTVWEREIIAITTGARELGQVMANLGTMVKDVFTFKWGDVDANWAKIAADRQAGLDRVAAIQKEGDDKINAIAKQAAVDLQKILGGEPGAMKPQAPSSAAPNRSDISAQLEQFQTQIKLADAAYKQRQEELGAEVKLHQITYDQETQLLLQALDKRHTAELAALAAEQQIGGLTTAQYQKIIDERKVKDQEYAAAHQKIMNEAAEKDVQAWQSALTPLTSAFNSQLKGLLSGTESWATATKRIVEDLVMIVIQKLETLAVEQAAMGLKNLTMSATGGAGGGPMSWLGSLFGGGAAAAGGAGAAAVGGAGAAAGQAAQDTAVTANTTALTALTTGLTADVTGQTAITTALAALDADLIVLAPEIVALTAAVLENTAVLTASKLLPSYASGSWSLSHDQIALVHAGEMIAPNDGSAGALRSMLSGGGAGAGSVTAGGVTHVHNWTAWDGPSVQSWLTRGGMDQIARALSAYAPLHPSTA